MFMNYLTLFLNMYVGMDAAMNTQAGSTKDLKQSNCDRSDSSKECSTQYNGNGVCDYALYIVWSAEVLKCVCFYNC